MSKAQIANGIAISPMPPDKGNPANIEYSGNLQAGSSGVTLCVAYGTAPGHLFSQQEFPMQKQGTNWVTSFKVSASDQLNLSFKDSQGNIDDNQGKYYTVPVNSDYQSYA